MAHLTKLHYKLFRFVQKKIFQRMLDKNIFLYLRAINRKILRIIKIPVVRSKIYLEQPLLTILGYCFQARDF
jgi:hypothetical protein